MKRILICGGRDYGLINPGRPLEFPRKKAQQRRAIEVIDGLFAEHGPFVLIHGGAKGADALAADWARNHAKVLLNLPEPEAYPADWSNVDAPGAVVKTSKKSGRAYNVLAGHQRNQKMIDVGRPDLVVAFPGGTGTADMIERARKANIEVREVK